MPTRFGAANTYFHRTVLHSAPHRVFLQNHRDESSGDRPESRLPRQPFQAHQFEGPSGGTPTLIAAHGIVYDVSKSYHWRKGRHQVLHHAGADLTAELAHAPHSAHFLERVPVVGKLREP